MAEPSATIHTARFGDLAVDPERVITFERGLVGFADQRRFLLLDHRPGSPFHWLQSVERGDLAFPLAAPGHFVEGFSPSLPADLDQLVGPFHPDDLWLGAVVTFLPDAGTATINLRAPVVLNTRSRLGVQLVVDHPSIPIQHPIGSRR
jgi:flagellar assembly factor FliW